MNSSPFQHSSQSSSMPSSNAQQSRPTPIHQLSIKTAFDGLDSKEKLYAHHMAKAAWSGTRIILRQVSDEANDIFDLIMEIQKCCWKGWQGRWAQMGAQLKISSEEVDAFLDFAAKFLSNVGNFYVSIFGSHVARLSLNEIQRDQEIKRYCPAWIRDHCKPLRLCQSAHPFYWKGLLSHFLPSNPAVWVTPASIHRVLTILGPHVSPRKNSHTCLE